LHCELAELGICPAAWLGNKDFLNDQLRRRSMAKGQQKDNRESASPSFQVLRGLRATACGYFSTVLGPGTNQAHASHFHFDMAVHGKSQNYRICE